MRAKKFIAALLIAVLSISIFPKGVKAIDNTETWESKYTDDTRKVWKINFSSPLSGSVDSNNIRDYIYLQDYNNNKINVSITIASDRKYVEVSYPHYGYEKNKNYYLVIKSGLQSKDGKKTTKTIKIPFVVNDFIYFKDKNLENEIRKNISKPKGGILKEDVVNVQALYLSNRNIESLEGLNYFTNLKTLSINDNKVKDITPLKNLSNLEKLYAENNIIEDITNLKGLYKLKELNLRGNRIQNIDALSSLSSYYLISLDLGNNKVSKVSSLTYLTGLTSLKLDNNYIEDITSIKNLTNLKTLYLDKNDITNYSPVLNYYDKLLYKDFSLDYPISITDANLQKILREEINKPKGDLYYRDFANMKELDLSNASIYSLTGIKNLTSLEKLNLSGIKATNFSELQYLKNLKELNINDTSSHSKSFLSSLKDLEILNASDANVYGSDLYYLRNLVDLTELDLSDNNIYSDDLEELIDLNKLLKLSLKGNPHLDSIDELKNHMKNLVYLNIADTNITNGENLLSTINTFPKLESLDTTNLKLDKEVSLNQRINFLDSNFEGAIREVIQKYSGDIYTKDIRNIEKLELQNKNISNISGIENFAALKYLDLSNNNIVNVKPLNSLINLETLILHDNKVNTEANSFSNLDKLTYLDLSNNNITSISCLEVLTGLKKLDLSNNSIERINELRGLKSLEYLSLYNNKIGYNDTVDGKPREPANLGYLGYMFNLKELFLGENTLVRDYSYILSYYERLQNKDFTIDLDKAVFKLPDDSDGTLIKDAVKAKGCSVDPQGYIYYKDAKNITELDLSNKGITDLEGMQYFINLASLNLSNNSIANTESLGNLRNLKKLNLSNAGIKNNDNGSKNNIEYISNLVNLNELRLDYNYNIIDITPLKNLSSLTTLYLPTGKTNDFYLPTSDYYYNLINKNFNISSTGLITIERIDDIFLNINKGDKYDLPSTVTAKMNNASTRQLEIIWDNYNVDTAVPGVYNYYGTVEGYTRKIKLTLNVIEDRFKFRGNSIGNIMNKGLAASDDKWIYYSNLNDGGKLYKEPLQGGRVEPLTYDEVSYINVYDGWVYFLSKGDMYRIKSDGSSLTRITSDNAAYINLVDGYLYYFDPTKGGIWKIDIDDIGYGEVSASKIRDGNNNPYSWDMYTQIAVENDYVYFQNLQDSLSLYKMRIDGSETYSKINTGEVRNINIYGDYLYFTEGNKIYKIRKNGSDKVSVTYRSSDYINVSEGWIYFRNDSDGGKLYKIKTDGSYLTKLSDDKVRNINVIENYIYYVNESDGFKLARIEK